ncbi:MAG: beta strand repeat-containing protein, partial [Tsuneonella sp.]
GAGLGTGSGGNADGSTSLTDLLVTDSTYNVHGATVIIGQSAGGNGYDGGDAVAGQTNANFVNSTVNIASGATLSISANAFGGNDIAGDGATGGNATGGTVYTGFVNSNVTGAGTLEVSAFGRGGDSGAVGGAASGGSATLALNGASVSVADVEVNADGEAGFIVGNANSSGAAAGAGTGGNATIDLTNGTLVASGTIDVSAEGDGGEVDAAGFTGVAGGAGTGGTALLLANNGTNTVTAGDLRVDGSATGGTIFGGVGTGGSATGGLASLHTGNAGVTLTVNGPTTVVADGEAHSAQEGGTGGLGLSGVADVSAAAGAALTFNGDLTVEANSEGGDGTTAGAAGVGTAPNQAAINADNATITVNGLTFMTANALGGVGDLGGTGVGGAANAGSALALAQNGGTLTFNGSADVDAVATGGASTDGTGGAAAGGTAQYLATGGGAIAAPGATTALNADSSAYGGFASGTGAGGAAMAGTALVEAGAGGIVNVGGLVVLNGDASGGDGVNGGDAFGSTDPLVMNNAFLLAHGGGSITVAGTTALTSSITGGDGRDGGTGGDATGGTAVILAATNTAGTNGSHVTLGDVVAFADTEGGLGGNGTVDPLTGNYTGPGGAGGNAIGGAVSAFGDAGNGQLVITGSGSFEVAASGGTGGDGTAGGVGGNGIGGNIQVGTRSGQVTPDNTGSATFADVTLVAVGIGGDGGRGETGAGGAGGDGTNGAAILLVRGSQVTVDTASLLAYALGGNGGTGATGDGAGGDGIGGGSGGVGLTVTSRFNQASDRGSLAANTIAGSVFAFGGSGSTAGAAIIGETALQVLFSSADATIGQLGFTASGDTVTATAPDQISLTDATVNVGDFSFSTPNDVVLTLDNATLNATNFFLSARALLLPATAPTMAGTLNVSGTQEIVVADGGALQTYANINVTGPFTLSNTGAITTGNVTATGDIFIDSANGSVSTGNLSGGLVSLSAGQAVTTGSIVAAGLNVAGSTVTLGNVTSSDFVVIDAATAATAGGIQAQSITVNGGTITASGLWQAGSIALTGSDLNIASTGGLNAGTSGSITIASTNAAGAFIGDGLGSVSGFTLSNGEVGRIAGGAILIAAQDYSGNAVDLTIGDLTIGGTQLGGPSGYIDFAAGDAALSTPSGRIRVNGTITATGLATTNAIVFLADSVEINAATGGIFASGTSGTLGGSIVFDAKNIHVASDEILLRLRDDPFYAGHIEDLNTPGAIDRPDGVLNAYALVFYPRETLFIQNTGTASAPAGFYARIDESDIEPPGFSDPTAPDVEVIINGKFQTDTGDVTGRAAYQLVVDNAESMAGFSDSSQINGCSLSSGSCTTFVDNTPPPTNADEITAILTEDQAQEEPFDTDNDEDKEQAEEAARAPIAPPVVLIDSRPLNPDVDVTDPVSGTGNPALIGASISADAQGEPK